MDSDIVLLLESPDASAARLEGKKFRVFYTLRREAKDELLAKRLQTWIERIEPGYRNLVVFVAPGRGMDLKADPDFIWNIKELIAAEEVEGRYGELARRAPAEARKVYNERMKKAREIARKSGARVSERLREIQWCLISFVFYPEKNELRPYIETYEKGFPTYEGVRGFFKERYLRDPQPIKDEILTFISSYKEDARIQGFHILDHFYGAIGVPIIVDEGVAREALAELAEEKKIYLIIDNEVYHGTRPTRFDAKTAIVTRKPVIAPALPPIKIPPAVPPKLPKIEIRTLGPDRPFQVLQQFSELAEAQKVGLRKVRIEIDCGKDVPLTSFSEVGLPQITVKDAKITLDIELEKSAGKDLAASIINSLTALRKLNIPLRSVTVYSEVEVSR